MRKVLAIVAGLIAAYMLITVFTVPMVVGVTPAILMVAFGVAAYVLWPRHQDN
jgi:hypothetical protein